MKPRSFFIFFALGTTPLLSQRDYIFASTGQQKLLINPSFCAGSEGIQLQTLASSYPYPVEQKLSFANYTGLSYRRKKLSFGLSNTYYKGGYYSNSTNQTDLSAAYTIKLSQKVTLVPSIQMSIYELKGNHGKTSGNSISITPGILMDIKNLITFGASFYDINQPGGLSGYPIYLSQLYHVSFLLFRNKALNVERYFILKKQHFAGFNENYIETGAYRSYKFISLHTAARVFVSGFGRYYSGNQNDWSFIAGLHFTYKKLKFGYTIYNDGDTGHELFLSFNILNTSQLRQRSLMLN